MDQKIFKPLTYLSFALCAVIPWSLAAMQILLGCICLYFIILLIYTRTNLFYSNKFYIWPGLYLIVLIVSAGLSIDPAVTFHNLLHTYWFLLTLPFLASIPLTAPQRKQAFDILIYSSAVVGIYAIFQFFTGTNPFGSLPVGQVGNAYRSIGMYSHFLTFAGNQLMVFGLAYTFLIDKSTNLKNKWIYIIAAMIIGFSLVTTRARGAWLGAIVIIVLGAFLYYRKQFWKIIGISIVLFVTTAFIMPDIWDRFTGIFSVTHQHNVTRINLWKTSWLIIKDHWLLGIGPGLFERYFELYKIPGFYDATSHPHNDYLNVLVHTGIFGIVIWLIMWIAFFKQGLTNIFRQSAGSTTNSLALKGSVLAIAGILVAAFFQCYFIDLENSILWWVLVGLTVQVFNSGVNNNLLNMTTAKVKK